MMKFQLGRLVITPAVLKAVSVDEICWAIDRHVCGQWGNVPATTHAANEAALLTEGELVSVHRLPNGTELRLITTADRLTTTVDLTDNHGHQRTPEWTPAEYVRVKGNSGK